MIGPIENHSLWIVKVNGVALYIFNQHIIPKIMAARTIKCRLNQADAIMLPDLPTVLSGSHS